ncbi:MAG: hypothetical protein H6812_04445 [Phycisphaeraceae bacterium]|nr:hypothetical protein [Phycisphaerales bacterium]MCB9842487.1 hypothetical protein [Phycisphaeraceae bacterium]
MAYEIFQRESRFIIKAGNITAAFNALKHDHASAVAEAHDFSEAMDFLGWTIHLNQSGDVWGIEPATECYDGHELPLIAVAPFVEPDCSIEMQGEDGKLWRWEFRDCRLFEMRATITWEQAFVWPVDLPVAPVPTGP